METDVVGKRGATTGLTFGDMNEIEAVIRSPDTNGRKKLCWALLIVPEKSTLKFSGHEDSGSCTFDCSGHVVDMVVVGTNHPNVNDGRGRGILEVESPYMRQRLPMQLRQKRKWIALASPLLHRLDGCWTTSRTSRGRNRKLSRCAVSQLFRRVNI